ncbi:MAG TPA: two-component system response regulator [Microscillaceae bacterium]|nr:two-component system response regulator [Microscillaceae bacterium]
MNKIKVAIVEDNNMMRFMLLNFLNKHFEVNAFENGLVFFEWLENAEIPDLVVTDISMPEMNGFELTASLKSSQLFKNIAVMVLSGLDESQDRIKCLQLGAEDYLMKPFNPEELLVKINKYMKNKSSYEKTSNVVYQSK